MATSSTPTTLTPTITDAGVTRISNALSTDALDYRAAVVLAREVERTRDAKSGKTVSLRTLAEAVSAHRARAAFPDADAETIAALSSDAAYKVSHETIRRRLTAMTSLLTVTDAETITAETYAVVYRASNRFAGLIAGWAKESGDLETFLTVCRGSLIDAASERAASKRDQATERAAASAGGVRVLPQERDASGVVVAPADAVTDGESWDDIAERIARGIAGMIADGAPADAVKRVLSAASDLKVYESALLKGRAPSASAAKRVTVAA